MIGRKPLSFRFDKAGGLIRVYDRTWCLILFGHEKYNAIYKSIRHLISLTEGSTYIISHNYAKIQIDLYDYLPLQKTLTFHDYMSHFLKNMNITTTMINLRKVLI